MVSIAQFFKIKYKANLEIPGGGGVQIKDLFLGEVPSYLEAKWMTTTNNIYIFYIFMDIVYNRTL